MSIAQQRIVPAADELTAHPLADLFPLIEGAEFDELVSSIRENGQLEPIVLFHGMILDGRNRYRACREAGVDPIVEEFRGRDALTFVTCKNIHRRQLNESQRSMIAARLCNMKAGSRTDLEPRLNLAEVGKDRAAELLNVSRATVTDARTVLSRGTEEEIRAVEKGDAAVTSIARAIRRSTPPDERKQSREAPRAHTAVMQMHADIWRRIRDAVENLTSLPLPSDVVAIARSYDKRTKGAAIDARLASSLQWLTEFSDAWNDRND